MKRMLCLLVLLALLPCLALAAGDRLAGPVWHGSRNAGQGVTTDITLTFGSGTYHFYEVHAASGQTISDFEGDYLTEEWAGMYNGSFPSERPGRDPVMMGLQFMISDDSQSLTMDFGTGLALQLTRAGGAAASPLAESLRGVWFNWSEQNGQYAQALLVLEADGAHYVLIRDDQAHVILCDWSVDGDKLTLTHGGEPFSMTVAGDQLQYTAEGKDYAFTRVTEMQ